MSTSKTCSAAVFRWLLLLFALSACAPLSSTSRSELDPVSGPLLQPERETSAELLTPEESSPPEQQEIPPEEAEGLTVAEPEVTTYLELKELQALGNWEEGLPAAPDPAAGQGFPLTINKQVEFYLDFFQYQQPQTFARWLARSGRYLPLIRKELEEAGLPLELAYLPMIESGYSLTAYSSARAVGPWQFMSATARHYGLRIDEYVDERRDPVKSTRAAVRYLTRLYDEFGSWQLAVAGYNAGEGKIRWAMRKADTSNFWHLGEYLHLETKRYVPKLIAAIIIAMDPAKYGFSGITYEEPLEFETVEVPRWTPLQAVAVACREDSELLKELNRELRQGIVPPRESRYALKVPKGTAALVSQNLPRVRPVVSTEYKTHTVRGRETLPQICRQYNLNKLTLLKANSLRSAALSPGQQLRIPFQSTTYELLAEGRPNRSKPAVVSPENLILHTVRPGETASKIAAEYGVPAHLLVSWNHLEDINRLRAGQQLALYLQNERPATPAATGTVIEPKTFKLTAVRPGHDLRMRQTGAAGSGPNPSSQLTYYQVQGGDTLWTIARKYNLSTNQIKRWNNLKGDIIRPGSRLLLRLEQDVDA